MGKRYLRNCITCNTSFISDRNCCRACEAKDRLCDSCNRIFHGTTKLCVKCRSKERTCKICETTFIGISTICNSCQAINRMCINCGRSFYGHHSKCATCQKIQRICLACGKNFYSSYLLCETCSGRRYVRHNRRRALKQSAEIAGPISASTYLLIVTSGSCVYCGKIASTVDHITPLARGGHEAIYNLAPACRSCNLSKSDLLLYEWIEEKVIHALTRSPIVLAEYKQQIQRMHGG